MKITYNQNATTTNETTILTVPIRIGNPIHFSPCFLNLIQSFPDTFVFAGTETDAYRQIGNAIPPVMFWHIAKKVSELLKDCGI